MKNSNSDNSLNRIINLDTSEEITFDPDDTEVLLSLFSLEYEDVQLDKDGNIIIKGEL